MGKSFKSCKRRPLDRFFESHPRQWIVQAQPTRESRPTSSANPTHGKWVDRSSPAYISFLLTPPTSDRRVAFFGLRRPLLVRLSGECAAALWSWGVAIHNTRQKAPPPIRETKNRAGRRSPNNRAVFKVGGFPPDLSHSLSRGWDSRSFRIVYAVGGIRGASGSPSVNYLRRDSPDVYQLVI